MSGLTVLQLTQLVVLAQINDASTIDTPQAVGKFVELKNAYDKSYTLGETNDYDSFRWYSTKKGVEFAKKLLDSGVTNTETIAESVHQGFVQAALEFIKNPDIFGSTKKQRENKVINNILECFQKLIDTKYTDLIENNDQKRSCLLTANTLINAYIKQDE